MKFDIELLVLEYNGKVLQAIGIRDSSDTRQLNLSDEVMEAIEDDKQTQAAIDAHFQYAETQKGKRYIAECEIYHLTGEYGKLKIYTTTKEIEL